MWVIVDYHERNTMKMKKLRYIQAVSEALRQEMELDPDVFIIGEDVRHSLRKITEGFIDLFGPERVIDAPISETAHPKPAITAARSGSFASQMTSHNICSRDAPSP